MVMVRSKTGVDRGELFRLRVVDLDLPGTWTRNRVVLSELIDRSILAERRLLLRGANPSRHQHTSVTIHRDAAGLSRTLPNLFGPPVRRRRGVGVDQGRARRNLDYSRRVRAWIKYG